ncbi:hypothetical protein [Rhodopirellula bahusiensis]|uniref:hypothetical protein n=2 Tax=Rhodopirellula bahusiensis TaxID=2014065 RepID=UPI0032642DCA
MNQGNGPAYRAKRRIEMAEAPETLDEESKTNAKSRDNERSASKPRGGSQWRILKLTLSIVSLLAVLSAAWMWKVYRSSEAALEQARLSSAAMVEQARDDAEKLRYRERNPLSAEDIRGEQFQACLDRISVDVRSQKNRLRDVVKARAKIDPHLKNSLLNVYDEPLTGSEKPIHRSDLYEEFMIDIDVLIERFMTRHGQLAGIDHLAENLRDCLWHQLMNKHPPVQSLDAVKEYEHLQDPCIGLTLALCDSAGGSTSQLNRIRDASDQIAEKPEDFDALLAAWVHTISMAVEAQHYDADRFDDAVRRFLSSWPIAWQQFSDRPGSVGRDHACLLRMLSEIERLNASAKIDFFDALTSGKEEGVPDFVLHAVAFHLLNDVAWEYRGNQFVSDTNESDFDVYVELATMANAHAVEAYVQRPDLAMLATDALNIQRQLGQTPLSRHHWFRLALSGHLDYESAYGAYAISLMPRWGGSELLQKAMTLKCLETDSPDGSVEMYSSKFIAPYLKRKSKDESVIDDPSNLVWARKFISAWKKYHSHDRNFGVSAELPSWALHVFWEAGDFESAIQMMEALGGRVGEVDWVGHNMNRSEFWWVSNLAKGKSKELWMPLHRQVVFNGDKLNAGQIPQLRENLDAIEKIWLADQDAIKACCTEVTDEQVEAALATVETLLQDRRDQLGLLERYHHGEQIHFTLDELNATLQIAGSYQQVDWRTSEQCIDDAMKLTKRFEEGANTDIEEPVDDVDETEEEETEWNGDVTGGFQVTVDRMNRFFYLENNTRYPLPARYEVTVTTLKDEYSPYGMGILCGPEWNFGLRSELNGMVFRFAPGSRYFYVNDLPDDSRFKPNYREWAGVPESYHTMQMRIDVGHRGYQLYADDKLLHESRQPLRTGGIFQVGRASNRAYDIDAGKECVYDIYDFKVQKLDQEPLDELKPDDTETPDASLDSERFDSEGGTRGFI